METTENIPRRNVKHCGLCRQPNHNVRKCPQIDVLDQTHLDRIQRFLLENDVFTIEGGIRYRFAWLQERELIELRALSRKYRLAYKIMDKRDMYRCMRRRGLYEIMLENKQLRARNEILEKKLRELHSINEFYMEEFAMPKYNVDRYFKSYPLKDSSSIDSSSMSPLSESSKTMMWTWCWSVQDINDIQKPLMTEEEERLYYERWSWFPSSSRQNTDDS